MKTISGRVFYENPNAPSNKRYWSDGEFYSQAYVDSLEGKFIPLTSPPPGRFTPALPQTTSISTAIRERPTFSTWDTAPARVPVGLESSYIPIRKAGELPAREAFVPELRVGRPPGLGEKVFEGLRLATGQPHVKTTPGIEPGSGGNAEIMRVVGSGLSAFSGGLTDIPGYLQRRMTGEVVGGAPRTVGGAIASAPLALGGFIKGPMALAQSRLGPLAMPAGASKLEQVGRLTIHGGKTLGLASIYGGITPAIMESERLSQVPMEIAKSGATGATMGFLYPWLGVMKNKGAQQAVRVAFGVAMMDVLRSGGKQGIFTLDDVAKATINGEIDPKQLAEATLGVLQDAYFSAVQPTYRKAKVAEITKTRELTPLDQTILNMKPVDIQSAMSALTKTERLLPLPSFKASPRGIEAPTERPPGIIEVDRRGELPTKPEGIVPAKVEPAKRGVQTEEQAGQPGEFVVWLHGAGDDRAAVFPTMEQARKFREAMIATRQFDLVEEPTLVKSGKEHKIESAGEPAKTSVEGRYHVIIEGLNKAGKWDMKAGQEVGGVSSLKEASLKYSRTIKQLEKAGGGGSKTPEAVLTDSKGVPIARISYNGNVWDAKNPQKLLYNATGLVQLEGKWTHPSYANDVKASGLTEAEYLKRNIEENYEPDVTGRLLVPKKNQKSPQELGKTVQVESVEEPAKTPAELAGKSKPSIIPEVEPVGQLKVTIGGSHRTYQKQMRAFRDVGIPIKDVGAATLGSKNRTALIPDTPEARDLLKKVGGRVSKEQWHWLKKNLIEPTLPIEQPKAKEPSAKLVDQLAQKYGEKTGTTPVRIGMTDKWQVGDKTVSLKEMDKMVNPPPPMSEEAKAKLKELSARKKELRKTTRQEPEIPPDALGIAGRNPSLWDYPTVQKITKKISDKVFGVSHTGEKVEPDRLIAVPRDKTKPVQVETVGGVKIIKPEPMPSSDKDMNYLEYGLGSLFVGDIHPYMESAVKDVNLSDQKTVHATRLGIEKVQDIFSGIKGNMLNQILFRLRGGTLPNLNDMARSKIPVPKHLEKPVLDLKETLEEYRQKVIEFKRENLFSHLTSKQVEYARWLIAGSKGDPPKNIKASTKIAADGVVKEWNDLAAWGKENYFPEHFSGAYKYVDSETGGIVASGQTARQATANLEAFLAEHPEAREHTYQPTNDLVELLTLRRTLNPDLVSDIRFWGSVLSRKDYAMLQSQVKSMVANLSGMKPKDVKIDLKGIAKVFPGGKFSPHFMEKKTELKGDFQDPERVMIAYVINIERKLGLEKMRQRSFDYAQKLRESGKPVAAGYLENLATNVAGRYDLTNRVVDSMLGKRLGLKPFLASRTSSSLQQFVAGATLGYSLVKAGLNRIGGMMHTNYVPGVRPRDFVAARKWTRTDEGRKTLDEIGYRLGLDTFFTDTGKLKGVTKKIYEPTGMFNLAEMQNRPEAFAVIYQKARREGMSHNQAVEHAIDIAQLTQGLYNTAARPVIIGMGGPAVGTAYQFKQYMMNEARMINRFKSSPEFWAKYIPGTIMLAGSRGAWLTIKSMLFLTIAQRGIEEMLEEWNTKHPELHRGLPGTLGIDVSAPTTWQLPQTPSDLMGPVYKGIMKTGQFLIKGLRNMHFTDEEIARYIQTVAPVANLIWEGLQLVKTGEVKQGEQVKYRGNPWEGMVNILGARTVEQSRQMDTSRYWRETQRMFNKEGEFLRQRFNEADTDAERWKVLEKMFDKGHPLTGLDQAMINNLMTQEERAIRALSPALKIKKMQMEQKGD